MKIIGWLTGIVTAMALLSTVSCAGKGDKQDQQTVPEIEDTLELRCLCCECQLEEIVDTDTISLYENN